MQTQEPKKSAGLVCGIIGMVPSIILFVTGATLVSALGMYQ